MGIHRITLFKIQDSSHQDEALQRMRGLKDEAKKDGKSYIRSLVAGPTVGDSRNQGYTFFLELGFDSVEDMKYYDEADEAHVSLKKALAGKVQPPPLVLFSDNFVRE